MGKSIWVAMACFCSIVVLGQKEKSVVSQPLVIGAVEQLKSSILKENRTLNIYLPEGYQAKDTVRYPVIYVLDGSMDEDFLHIAGLVQYNSFEWIGRVPKSIVVGIGTVDRRRDFTFPTTVSADKKKYPTTGGSAAFIDFVAKELQPFINQKYRTNGQNTLIGQSLGGLLETQILLEKTTLFSTYIIVSPSLWWDDGSTLQRDMTNLSRLERGKVRVYLGVGKEGLTPSPTPHVMEVDANLLAEKMKTAAQGKLELYFDYLPEENHATILHQAVMNAFRLLAQKH